MASLLNTVLLFGFFDPGYSRNAILIKGFERLGWSVKTCSVDTRQLKGWRKYFELARLGWRARGQFDLLLVAYPGHAVVWLARILFGKKIIFDAFVSLYNSNVEDRAAYGRWSLAAWRDKFLDWYSCRLAAIVLLDTPQHVEYFNEHIGRRIRYLVVPVGSLDSEFFPKALAPREKFIVHFHGSFIPLHGIDFILKAAEKLRQKHDIKFQIVGRGQEYAKMRELAARLALTNVNFYDPVPYIGGEQEGLADVINKADICLGIFGQNTKADRVVPNKIYEYAACGKPIITARTTAMRASFVEREELMMCDLDDPQKLADLIVELKTDAGKRAELSQNILRKFKENFTPERLVGSLLSSVYGVK